MAPRFTPDPTLCAAIEAACLARQGRWQGTRLMFSCPLHEDRTPSASWDGEKHVWTCFACERQGHPGGALALAKLLGLPTTPQQIAPPTTPQHAAVAKTTEYKYTDDAGNHTVSVWRQDFADGTKRIWQSPAGQRTGPIKGLAVALYRLPELRDRPHEVVYLVEGEKCVELLRLQGLLATTSIGGSNHWRPEYAAPLAGRSVVILPDHDDPGRKYAAAVAHDLLALRCEVRMAPLPGLQPGEDVYDWLTTHQHDAKALVAHCASLDPLPLPPQSIWTLRDLLTSPPPAPQPLVGEGLLFPGSFALLAGQPGYGKSWLALDLALSVSLGLEWLQHPAMSTPRPLQIGLVSMELPAHFLAERFRTLLDARGLLDLRDLRGPGPILWPTPAGQHVRLDEEGGPARLRQFIETHHLDLLILDPFSRFHISDENDSQAVGAVLEHIDQLRHTTGCAILLVHHSRKPGASAKGDDELFAVRGSSRLLSDPQTIFLLTKIKGQPTLKLVKANYAAPIDPVTLLRLPGGPLVAGDPPPSTDDRVQEWLLAVLADHPGGLTVSAIAKLPDSPTRNTISRHLTRLMDEGKVDQLDLPGRSKPFILML